MFIRHVPFARWPVWLHVALATFTTATLVVVAYAMLQSQHVQLSQAVQAAEEQQTQLIQARQRITIHADDEFVQSLPPPDSAENVARDLTAFGNAHQLQISSVGIERTPASATILMSVSFHIAARGDYKRTKSWMAELLARYPSLYLRSLSLQAPSNDAAVQDIRVNFVLYVRA